jgi:hypothetical protein
VSRASAENVRDVLPGLDAPEAFNRALRDFLYDHAR